MKASAELSVLIIELENDRKDAPAHEKHIYASTVAKVNRVRSEIIKRESGINKALRQLAKYHEIQGM